MKPIALLPYLLIVAGLLSTLALFFTLKREMRKNAQNHRRRIDEMMTRLEEAEAGTRLAVQASAQIPAPPPEPAFVPVPLRAGLNLNTRVHAMRMLRRGEDVGHIAAALGVPRREVELMIRVQTIGMARAAASGE